MNYPVQNHIIQSIGLLESIIRSADTAPPHIVNGMAGVKALLNQTQLIYEKSRFKINNREDFERWMWNHSCLSPQEILAAALSHCNSAKHHDHVHDPEPELAKDGVNEAAHKFDRALKKLLSKKIDGDLILWGMVKSMQEFNAKNYSVPKEVLTEDGIPF